MPRNVLFPECFRKEKCPASIYCTNCNVGTEGIEDVKLPISTALNSGEITTRSIRNYGKQPINELPGLFRTTIY